MSETGKRRREESADGRQPPLRFSVCSWNIWKKFGRELHNWENRRPALQDVLRRLQPDILGIQEAHTQSMAAISEALPEHERVHDDSHQGWECEGNLFWNTAIFEKEAHGTADAGIPGNRAVFWVLLRVKAGDARVVVSTAHLTWQGAEVEIQGSNPRLVQSQRMADAVISLARTACGLSDDPEVIPALLMGDFNEGFHPRRILEAHGFRDCFRELGLAARATHPQRPCVDEDEEHLADHVLDWIFALSLPSCSIRLRCLLANVLQGIKGGFASDHMPVAAVYELGR